MKHKKLGNENEKCGNEISKYLGEFTDKELEKHFFSSQVLGGLKYLEHIFLSIGIIFLLFIIPDFIIIKNNFKLVLVLINRLAFFIITMVLYYLIKNRFLLLTGNIKNF